MAELQFVVVRPVRSRPNTSATPLPAATARARRGLARRQLFQLHAPAARGAAQDQAAVGDRLGQRRDDRRAAMRSSAPAASAADRGRAPSPGRPAPAGPGPSSSSRAPLRRCCRGAGCRPGRRGGIGQAGVGGRKRAVRMRGGSVLMARMVNFAARPRAGVFRRPRRAAAYAKPAVTIMVKAARAAGNVLLRTCTASTR